MSKAYSRVYLGLPGAGKTVLAIEHDVIPALESGIEVWSSTWLNWKHPNFHYFSSFNEIKNVRNSLIFFDEIAQILEPREWQREGSGVRRFFQLHRHRHNDIIGTTQEVSLVAKSALIIIGEWYFCSDENNFFSGKTVNIRRELLTLSDLRKPLDASDTAPVFIGDDLQISDEKSHVFCFTHKMLLHHELDNDKQELIHLFCPRCGGRQFDDGTGMCPKHHSTALIQKESAMYDTDFDPDLPISLYKPTVSSTC